MRRAHVLAAGVMLAGLLVRAPMAWACSCAADSPKAQAKRADAVFVGVATAIEAGAQGEDTAVHFSVREVYKGSIGQATIVRTPGADDSCRVEVVQGTRYAVFGEADGGTLSTSLCSGTTQDTAVIRRAGLIPSRIYTASPTASTIDPNALVLTDNPGRSGPIAAAAMLLVAAALGYGLIKRGTLRRIGKPGGPHL